MQSSQEPLPGPNSDSAEHSPASQEISAASTFEQELEAVEQSLHSLKDRYQQVQRDQQLEAQLQARRAEIKQQLERSPTLALKSELEGIQNQLVELEVNLESRLFSWGSVREPFWQIVRFGGLGIILGWLLAFAVMQQPKPTPPNPPATSQSSP